MKSQKEASLILKPDSDIMGALASGLCMMHCIITPFLFAALATTCSEVGPLWWKMVDFVFLVITFIAIRYTAKSTGVI